MQYTFKEWRTLILLNSRRIDDRHNQRVFHNSLNIPDLTKLMLRLNELR